MHRLRTLAACLLVAAALALLAALNGGHAPALAEGGDGLEPAGTPFVVAQQAPGEIFAAVAYSADADEYLAVWSEQHDKHEDIYGQRIAENGALLGQAIPIATSNSRKRFPTIAYSSIHHEYLVTWSDDTQVGGAVNAQRVSVGGSLVGNPIPIAASHYTLRTSVAYNNAHDEYLIAWDDDRTKANSSDIYGQRVSGAGELVGSNVPLASDAANQALPSVSYNSVRDTYLIAWRDMDWQQQIGTRAQRIGSDGTPLGGAIPLGTEAVTTTSTYFPPALAYNPTDDEFLVAWNNPAAHTVDAHRVDGLGAPIGQRFVVANAYGDKILPTISYSAAGGEYLVAWGARQLADAPSYDMIYAQRVSKSGVFVGQPFLVSSSDSSYFLPSSASNTVRNEVLIAWNGDDPAGDAVLARRFAYPAAPLPSSTPTATATSTSTATATATSAPTQAPIIDIISPSPTPTQGPRLLLPLAVR